MQGNSRFLQQQGSLFLVLLLAHFTQPEIEIQLADALEDGLVSGLFERFHIRREGAPAYWLLREERAGDVKNHQREEYNRDNNWYEHHRIFCKLFCQFQHGADLISGLKGTNLNRSQPAIFANEVSLRYSLHLEKT